MKERGEEGNFREEVYSSRDKGRKRPVIREEIVNSEICTEKAMKVKKCREKRWRKKTSDEGKKWVDLGNMLPAKKEKRNRHLVLLFFFFRSNCLSVLPLYKGAVKRRVRPKIPLRGAL